MKIALACDHIAVELKNAIIQKLKNEGHEIIDCGTYNKGRTHYPIYGHKAASLVSQKKVDKAIVICGTGIGIANSVNKTKGSRCVLVNSVFGVKKAVENSNINVLAMGAKVTGPGLAEKFVDAFLNTKYIKNEQNDKKIEKINNLIKNDNYNDDIFDEQNKKWEEGFYHD